MKCCGHGRVIQAEAKAKAKALIFSPQLFAVTVPTIMAIMGFGFDRWFGLGCFF